MTGVTRVILLVSPIQGGVVTCEVLPGSVNSFSTILIAAIMIPVIVVVHHIEPVIGLNQSREVVTNLKNHDLNIIFGKEFVLRRVSCCQLTWRL